MRHRRAGGSPRYGSPGQPYKGSPTPHGRLPQDYRCRAMPLPVFDFGVFLWKLARGSAGLGTVSSESPPTACQLMMYYSAFGGSVGRHRDNFSTAHFKAWTLSRLSPADYIKGLASGHAASADENSQRVGSDVLLYTCVRTCLALGQTCIPTRWNVGAGPGLLTRAPC